MLRVLVMAGVLLMVVGFGAAGWQYWQGLQDQADATAVPGDPADAAEGGQLWLISATGGLVQPGDVQAFLVQDRLVRDRMVTVTLDAPIASLLTEGEALPADPFLPVFADIRAPLLARALCPVLTDSVAVACALHSARLVPDSLDPVRGTARFQVELAYRLDPAAGDLPDLAQHVLNIDRLVPGQPASEGETAPAPQRPASAEAALAAAVSAAVAPCAAEDHALGCRLLRLSVTWSPGAVLDYQAELGWLAPLPDGVIPVAPLVPAASPPQG